MNPVIRTAAVYFIVMILMRFSGKRTLSEMSQFDFVLLLIISEATTQALLGEDYSITAAFLSITTLIAIDVGLSLLKDHFKPAERVLDGLPLVLVEDGVVYTDRMDKSRVDLSDILQAARTTQGLESLDDIKYVVLEHSGGLAIIPKKQ